MQFPHIYSDSVCVVICRTEYTRDQLLIELASGTRVLMWTGIVVTTIAAGVLGYALIK